jgi:phosphate:Na+ symporter
VEGAAELAAFHQRILDNLRIAFGVFMSANVNEARKLLSEKIHLLNAELAAAERHLDACMRTARDCGDDLSSSRRVTRFEAHSFAHLFSCYPVLEAAGELTPAENEEAILSPLLHRRSDRLHLDRKVGAQA